MKNKTAALYLALTLTALTSASAHAKVSLPAIISDGMVLQRNQSAVIWGQAAPHESVIVCISGQQKSAFADSSGKWSVSLAPLAPGPSRTLTVSGTNTLIVKNVQVGDVWICSGQSNMNLPLGASDVTGEPIPAPLAGKIKLYQVMPKANKQDCIDAGNWITPTSHSALALPAIPIMFSRSLATATNIPVAIISTACDGAPIESYMAPETLKRTNSAGVTLPTPHKAGANFQARLLPIIPYKVKGVIWYQGESNLFDVPKYKTQLPAFITDLRARMHSLELPFLLVQLPNYGYRQPDKKPADSFWADMREAQYEASKINNVHLVVSIDTAGEDASSLHPKEKSVISERLAKIARDISSGGAPKALPAITSPRIENDSMIVPIKGADKLATSNGDVPTGFQLAGSDRKFYWADAEIIGNAIKLTSDEVVEPVAARYAWADNPVGNLCSGENPFPPFRTDNWATKPKLNPAAIASYQTK